MSVSPFSLHEDYWEDFKVEDADIEFLYNYLLETETPTTSPELTSALVKERIHREVQSIEQQRSAGGNIYLP